MEGDFLVGGESSLRLEGPHGGDQVAHGAHLGSGFCVQVDAMVAEGGAEGVAFAGIDVLYGVSVCSGIAQSLPEFLSDERRDRMKEEKCLAKAKILCREAGLAEVIVAELGFGNLDVPVAKV